MFIWLSNESTYMYLHDMANVWLAMFTRMCCHSHTETQHVSVYWPMFSCLHATFDLLECFNHYQHTICQKFVTMGVCKIVRATSFLLSNPSCETFSRKTSTKMHWVTVCNGIGHNRSKCNNPLLWHVSFFCLYDSHILYHPIHSIVGYMVRGYWFSFLCIGLIIGTMHYFVIFMI